MRSGRVRFLVAAGACTSALLLPGCGSGEPAPAGASSAASAPAAATSDADFPDVVAVRVTGEGDGAFTFEVTMSSPYDTPERYADGWRVLDGDRVLAEKELAHDHASEQPFTRTQTGVEIPEDVTEVRVEGRDLVNGYGGGTVTVEVPGR